MTYRHPPAHTNIEWNSIGMWLWSQPFHLTSALNYNSLAFISPVLPFLVRFYQRNHQCRDCHFTKTGLWKYDLKLCQTFTTKIRWEIHKNGVFLLLSGDGWISMAMLRARVKRVYVENVVRFVLFARYSFDIIEINMSYVSKFESFTGEYFTIY